MDPSRPVARKDNTLAIVSVVASATAYFVFPFVGAVVGIVTGHMARAEIRRTGEGGDALALTGLVLGYAHIAMTCVAIALFVAFYAGLIALVLGAAAAGA